MTATSFADRLAARFRPDLGRRSFLSRTAMVGTALAVTPTSYLMRPGDAYSQVCASPSSCPGGSRCRTYTELCCSIYGENRCPAGTVMAGWWRADGSGFCGPNAPRYYMDCNGYLSGCTCWGCNCNNWKQGCANFRYGNCNNNIPSVGPIQCRVISCTAPWLIDPGCSTSPRVDNNTRFHDRPCLHPFVHPPQNTDASMWAVTTNGEVWAQNSAAWWGDTRSIGLARPIVGMARSQSGWGYWLVASDGGIFAYNDAEFYGSTGGMRLNQPIVGMAATPSGNGYWLVASDGGVFSYGDAEFYGSTGSITLNQPIVGMAATSTGNGYWLVARDGGIFAFGDAQFRGSAGGTPTAAPFIGMVGRGNDGYWLASADGLVRAYGSAPALSPLSPPWFMTASISSICGTTSGNGYSLVGGDGGIYPYGDAGGRHGTPLPTGNQVVGCASFT